MLVYRASLERRQAFLFRAVDIAVDLFAMTCSVSRAHQLAASQDPAGGEALRLADLACSNGRRAVTTSFRAFWRYDDARKYSVGRDVLEGRAAWLEKGAMGLDATVEDLRPKPVAWTKATTNLYRGRHDEGPRVLRRPAER
jgi:hypothetical protein